MSRRLGFALALAASLPLAPLWSEETGVKAPDLTDVPTTPAPAPAPGIPGAPAPAPAAPAPGAAADEPVVQRPTDPEQLFFYLIHEAQVLHSRQRSVEALTRLEEAEKLKKDNPLVLNVKGSIYTGLRDFEKAQECFRQSEKLSPGAFEPIFNITEIEYVKGNYKEAEERFKALMEKFPKLRVEIRHLTLFKILVCQLKQGKIAEAETTMKSFTFMDDTPAYYFGKASFAFQKSELAEAQTWVFKAGQIFKQEENVPYLDSLMEARWIESLSVPELAKPATAQQPVAPTPDSLKAE